MTTLGGITEKSWSYYNEMTVREFFLIPRTTALCVYIVHDRLNVSLSFPVIPVYELTYFVRAPNEVLKADSFRSNVLFGTMNDKVESYVLGVVQNVLAPLFLKIESWPDSILQLNSSLISRPRGKFHVTILKRAESRNFSVPLRLLLSLW